MPVAVILQLASAFWLLLSPTERWCNGFVTFIIKTEVKETLTISKNPINPKMFSSFLVTKAQWVHTLIHIFPFIIIQGYSK
jgi:hypothetical protein